MKFSIITICLNSEKLIEQTIRSVIDQEYPKIEYIIVDGGSTDGTVGIIRGYAETDSRIKWVSEPDGGISDAMNKGVRMATGKFIAHLHSDEYYLDSQVLVDVASHLSKEPEAAWLTAGFHFVDESGRFVREIKVRRYSYRRLVRGNIILHPATFVRRDTFNDVGGFDLSVRYCMDYDLWLRIGAISDPIILKKSLAAFRVHPGSRSIADAGLAYAEEFKVRMNYLRKHGIRNFPYRLEYAVKKRLNRIFIKRLVSTAEKACGVDQ
jgi:glycosyltransferase involved in cell wall biosynthesis